ncbi:MAG: PAS domain S-box protein [Desulfobacteraceae bacterium]|jgi:PAS domain S-box-containing protein
METLIHILHLEDDPADAALIHAKIEEGELSCRITLVQTRDEYNEALQHNSYDIILADFKLPMYDGMSALGLTKELRPDIPFVFVSGTMGEDAAIEGLTKGATDYVLKQNLSRLPSAIKRALREARARRERQKAEIRLNEQLHFLQQLIDSIPIPVYYKDLEGLYLGCNAAFEAYTDCSRENIVGKTVHQVVPKERADKHHAADLDLLRHPGVQTYEISGIFQDGEHHDVVFNKATFVDADGCVAGTVGALMDITARKRADRERLANLEFFESMDRINRAIQGAGDPEEMMKDVLDVVLSTFDGDRAYLLYPCDPGAQWWSIPMERHKAEFPGFRDLKMEVPMDPQVAESFRILLAADGPVTFGQGTPHALPQDVSKQFGIKCAIAMAIHPKTGSPWQFGIHQCADLRIWTQEEIRLFLSIGRRLADGLSSLLSYRDLRKSEEFLDNVVEHIPNMIFVKDAQTLEFVRFNRAGEQLLGYSREDLLGKSDYDFFPKEVADFFTAKDREVLATKTLLDIPEETIRNRSGEERILHTQKLPILDDAGNPQFLLGISEDITERIQSQASIRKLSQAIEQSPVSIVITDIDGRIEFINAKFTQVTGYTFAEALGRNPRILKSGGTSDEEYKRLWETISSGGVWQGKFQNRKKNGELFWEQASIAPIRNTENAITHYLGVKEDITERKKLEEQLQQSQKMEAVGQLAGGVAHDFNNMLGVIMGRAELALEKVSPDDSLQRDLEEIIAAGLRSSEITRQLLAFSRKQTIEPKILDLNEAIEGMLKLLRRLIGEGIDLAWLPGANLWPVRIDPSQIDQVLANLCINAKDAIGGVGKITIETHRAEFDDAYCAKHEGFHPGEFVMLTVSDNGSGMDKPTMKRIFEPFFTTKGLGKGTGLGLATVYGIVKQNTGFINVYSEPEHGSTFKIYFPRHIVTADREQETIAAAPIPGGHETILVVEDEIMYLKMVTLMLEKFGYRVLSAQTPGEALALANEHCAEIHLLLTDLIMPEMNGQDLDREIKALYPDIISLFMSGYASSHIIHDGALDEGVHFIQKPFTSRALAKMVREVLDNK